MHPGIKHSDLSSVFVLSCVSVRGLTSNGSCNAFTSPFSGALELGAEAAVCEGVCRTLIDGGIEPGGGVETVSNTGVDGGPRTSCAICVTVRSETSTPLT